MFESHYDDTISQKLKRPRGWSWWTLYHCRSSPQETCKSEKAYTQTSDNLKW